MTTAPKSFEFESRSAAHAELRIGAPDLSQARQLLRLAGRTKRWWLGPVVATAVLSAVLLGRIASLEPVMSDPAVEAPFSSLAQPTR